MKEDLQPTQHERVIDLVQKAGIDISSWGDFKGGKEHAASNPKYCYEWSYVNQKNKVIVLNIWYSDIKFNSGIFTYDFNPRLTAEKEKGAKKKRAYNMDFALQKAVRENLPVRVIICDSNDTSKVERRFLDDDFWSVVKFNQDTGECTLRRGVVSPLYIDQFDESTLITEEQKTRENITTTYERDPQVRKNILLRAKGNCEYCGEKGFTTRSGAIYLESHHIIPLSEKGKDAVNNVIALCPNHHREAHYSKNCSFLQQEFIKIVGNKLKY